MEYSGRGKQVDYDVGSMASGLGCQGGKFTACQTRQDMAASSEASLGQGQRKWSLDYKCNVLQKS